MRYFNFTRLIQRYSVPFTVIVPGAGRYNDMGEYVANEKVEKQLTGAIISLKEERIYRSEGMLTRNDRQLYMLQPLENALIGATVIYEGRQFKITEDVDNSMWTGVYTYLLKHVSAFTEEVGG